MQKFLLCFLSLFVLLSGCKKNNPTGNTDTGHLPHKPKVTGPFVVYVDSVSKFSTSTTHPDSSNVCFQFSWGDGTEPSQWSSFVATGDSVSFNYSFSTAGTYYVRVRAKDQSGNTTEWSDSFPVISCSMFGQVLIADFNCLSNPGDVWGLYPHELSLKGNYVFFPSGASGGSIYVIDVSDSSHPATTAIIGEGVNKVRIEGNLGYAVDGNNLYIIDLSSITFPVIIDTVVLNSSSGAAAVGVACQGNMVYVSGGGPYFGTFSALKVVDVTNPISPQIRGSTSKTGGADIAVSGNYAFVAAYSAGVYVFDVSNPDSIVFVGQTGSGGTATSIRIEGSYAYVLNSGYGFSAAIMDISNANAISVKSITSVPDFYSEFDHSVAYSDLCVDGDVLYVATTGGVAGFDIRDKTNPKLIGLLSKDTYTGGVNVIGNLMLVGNRKGFQVYRKPVLSK